VRCLIATLFFNTFIVTDPDTERIFSCITPDLDNVVDMKAEILNIKRYILELQCEICHTHELLARTWLETPSGVELKNSRTNTR
jgi:hypothetical protein